MSNWNGQNRLGFCVFWWFCFFVFVFFAEVTRTSYCKPIRVNATHATNISSGFLCLRHGVQINGVAALLPKEGVYQVQHLVRVCHIRRLNDIARAGIVRRESVRIVLPFPGDGGRW